MLDSDMIICFFFIISARGTRNVQNLSKIQIKGQIFSMHFLRLLEDGTFHTLQYLQLMDGL